MCRNDRNIPQLLFIHKKEKENVNFVKSEEIVPMIDMNPCLSHLNSLKIYLLDLLNRNRCY
jgi:hypothetical protein